MTDRQTVSTADYEQLKKENEMLRNIIQLTQKGFGCEILEDVGGKLFSIGSTGVREVTVKLDTDIISKEQLEEIIDYLKPDNS